MLILIAIVDRAFGGRLARKLRAVLPERGLKAEKVVVTEVRNFVIILATRWPAVCWTLTRDLIQKLRGVRRRRESQMVVMIVIVNVRMWCQ